MTLGEFKALLRDSIKRGDAYDAQLNGFIRRAARFIEQNYTLQYMRKRFDVTTIAGSDTLALPQNVPIKSVEYLRFVASDGTRFECTKGELSDPEQDWYTSERYPAVAALNDRLPSRFYLDGVENLVFDRAFTEAMAGRGMLARYTDFPIQEDQTHWLLQNAEGLMLRQSMIEFFALARDDRAVTAILTLRQQDIQALLNADYETRYTGQSISL